MTTKDAVHQETLLLLLIMMAMDNLSWFPSAAV